MLWRDIMDRIRFIILLLLATSFSAGAAINSQYGFEGGVPSFVSAAGGAGVSASADKFKDGKQSLKFSWDGQGELVFSNHADLEASMKVKGAGLMMWVYNTAAIGSPLRFTIIDWLGKEICHFDFNMEHCGWRAIWIKYADMHSSDGGYYGDLPAEERKTLPAKMVISSPEGCNNGTIYIDRVSFSKTKLHDQITPDKQIPDNNCHLHRDMWQWCRLWEWEQYPEPEFRPVIGDEAGMLRTVEKRLDEWAAEGNPSEEYTLKTLMKRAQAHVDKYGIRRLPDGSITGAPLLSDDEFNNAAGEMRIRFIQEIVYWYALEYLYTGSEAHLPQVIDAMDHALDQGFAYGSGQGTNHHYGYQVRDLYKGIWILRKPLEKAGRLKDYVRPLTYWSGLQETRMPYEQTRDGVLDALHTLHNARVISALLQEGDDVKFAYMKALGQWTSGALRFTSGTLGGLKTDGTSFHHGGHYPGYSVGAFASVGDFIRYCGGTEFQIDETARRDFKKALMAMYDYTNGRDWGIGVCGRHPFNGSIPDRDVEAYAQLALLGDLTGQGLAADPDLAGAYLAMGGKNKNAVSAFKKAGIKAKAAEDGFNVYNYGAFGVHRRNGWMLTLKGFNSDVWSSEIYAADNRYGRYLSYGSAQIIFPEGAKAGGYSQEGWDWNRYPGVTSVHLPFDRLENPLKGTLMERNSSRFPGVSSLERKNGCLAFTYVEKDRPNFCAGATATKSVFCFDERIVFIGTGISNSSDCPTETTLYQLRLDNRDAEVDINDDYSSAFPYSWKQTGGGQVVLTDINGNFYIIPDARGLNVEKKHQSSPSDTKKKTGEGDFITAWIDHGISPSDASYEYLMLVRPNGKEVSRYSKKLPYEVLQADNSAHVVKDVPTGVTAYISYNGYASSATAAAEIPSETIVMERSRDDGKLVMSVCTPDLGITEKGYTTAQPSQPLLRTVTINGLWNLTEENPSVNIREEGGNTVLEVECLNGQPVEFLLTRKTSGSNPAEHINH